MTWHAVKSRPPSHKIFGKFLVRIGLRPGVRSVADLLARASSLLARQIVRDRPNFSSLQICDQVCDQVCDQDSVMEFGFYGLSGRYLMTSLEGKE